MLKSMFDSVMERRTDQMLKQVGSWLPEGGPLLDVGSGTGHLAARLERVLGVEVVATDVTDMHVMGRPPVIVRDGILPFAEGTFTGALLFFMLHYPNDPVGLLREVGRVTRGPIVIVQSVYSGRVGYGWLRMREFVWTTVAFHVSKFIGYVPSAAEFTMNARRFYDARTLQRDVVAAGLRVQSQRERPVLPGGALVVAGWMVARDD